MSSLDRRLTSLTTHNVGAATVNSNKIVGSLIHNEGADLYLAPLDVQVFVSLALGFSI